MKCKTRLAGLTVVMLGLLATPLWAENVPAKGTTPRNPEKATVATDVALGAEGVLAGQVVDPQGNPLPGVAVALRSRGRIVAQGRSDKDGRFAFGQVRGGVYQVAAADGFGTYRAWAPGTAPRSARPEALLVVGKETIRGQTQAAGSKLGRFITNPVVLAGGIGTAIAVPLAVQNSHGGGSSVDAGLIDNAANSPGGSDGPTKEPASE